MIKNEKSFQIELVFVFIFSIFNAFLKVDLSLQILAQVFMFVVLAMECINTGIEACVDMITKDFHPLAKIAKDTASAAVFLSIISAIFIWSMLLYKAFCE